jgi:hypothetical protein
MPLSNVERQRQWREKRVELWRAFTGTPEQLAQHIVANLGPEHARQVARALDKRAKAASRSFKKNLLGL